MFCSRIIRRHTSGSVVVSANKLCSRPRAAGWPKPRPTSSRPKTHGNSYTARPSRHPPSPMPIMIALLNYRLGFANDVNKMYYSTSLYTTVTESKKVSIVMKPEFDFNELFDDKNIKKLEESISKRKLNFNLNKLIYLWEKLKDVEDNMNFLKSKREMLKEEAKKFSKLNIKPEDGNYRTDGKRVRENLKKAKALYNSLSEELYISTLQLPNILHPDTPSKDMVIEVKGEKPQFIKNHVQFGSENHLLSYNHDVVHPGTCYLHSDLALLEMALQRWMTDALIKKGFTRFSSPDMYKPIALEAYGVDITNPEQVFTVLTSDSNMYLTGVSSAAFAAYYMMAVLEYSELPQRCFSVGTYYDATKDFKSFTGLHNLMQRKQIEIGCLCHTDSEEDVFKQIVTTLFDLYSKLPLQLRLVEVSVQDFLPSMYRKQAIEVWLPSTQEYHEVASVYSCRDYVSRRLKIRYPADSKQTAALSRKRLHAHTIHGTAVQIPVLLAVLLESCQSENNSFVIPAELKEFVPKAV
ncbi:serine--tRNA ligase-like [Antedon mediterranea]|uniref:serine--tRNA ligase-like n=1 Tax=Antedon mediterranea TaxID=105859 RepID=UPI003AF8DAD6